MLMEMDEYIPLVEPKKKHDKHSVYISNLCDDVTKFDLKELVKSNGIAPLHCIVAVNRKLKNKYGFVIFATQEEANQCVAILHKTSYGGKLLNVELAKEKSDKRVKEREVDNSGFVKNSFIVKGFPSNLSEEQVRESVKPMLKNVDFRLEKVGDKWKFVFENLSLCLSFASKLSSIRIKNPNGGTFIIHSVFPKVATNSKSAKAGRIFIKNLPFNITSDELASKFTKIDPNCKVHFPNTENNSVHDKCVKGFAFVQFTRPRFALKALKFSGILLKGRKIEVSLAVSKEYFTNDLKNNHHNDGVSDPDVMDIDDFSNIKKLMDDNYVKRSGYDEDSITTLSNDNFIDERQISDVDMDDIDYLSNNKQFKEDKQTGIKSIGVDSKKSKGITEKVTLGRLKEINKDNASVKQVSFDVNEGKTAFIQNVPFEATQQQLENVFQVYGELEYAKLVKDSGGKNKGTAFIKFKSKESLDNLLESELNTKHISNEYLTSDKFDSGERNAENLGVALLGRKLRVVKAVTKDEAEELKKNNSFKVDKRKLYLLKESLKGISDEQRDLLSKGRNRENRISNPNTFVSEKRICIRNLPIYLTKQELRDKLKKNVKCIGKIQLLVDKRRKVTNLKGERTKRGKRFGFVEFKTREQAKLALEFLNSTNVFGQKLVAEFSLEDKRALVERERRANLVKLRENNNASDGESGNQGKSDDDTKLKISKIKIKKGKKGKNTVKKGRERGEMVKKTGKLAKVGKKKKDREG